MMLLESKLDWGRSDIEKINNFFISEAVNLDLIENDLVMIYILAEIYEAIEIYVQLVNGWITHNATKLTVKHIWYKYQGISYDPQTSIYNLLAKKHSTNPLISSILPEMNEKTVWKSEKRPAETHRDTVDLKNDEKTDDMKDLYNGDYNDFWDWQKLNNSNYPRVKKLMINMQQYVNKLKQAKISKLG